MASDYACLALLMKSFIDRANSLSKSSLHVSLSASQMDPIGLQKKLDDLVNIVGSITKTMKEKHVDSPHSRYVSHSINHSRGEYPTSDWKDMRRGLKLIYLPSTRDQPADFKIRSPLVHQTFGYCIPKNLTRENQSYSPSTHPYNVVTPSPHPMAVNKSPTSVITPKSTRHTTPTHVSVFNQGVSPTPSDLLLDHHPASFVGPIRGHHCGRDYPPLSNISVAAPLCRSSPSLDGRPSIGSSAGSVPHDSPLGPTPSQPSQPLASPVLNPVSVMVIKKCIKKKKFPEPETECIHFVDANDITNNEDFFEDENEVVKLDSLHDLKPDLGDLEPVNLDTLAHSDPNLIKDISLDKVCLDDINLISKEADLTLKTLKLNSKDYDLIVSPTETTPNNSDLILDNSDGDVDNLKLEVSQLNLPPELNPDLIDPELIDLRVITKLDHIESSNMSSEDSNLTLRDYEPNLNNDPPLILLESILGVAPLDLYLRECVCLDWTYLTIPSIDFNVRGSIDLYLHVTSLNVVPTSILSLIPTGDSLGYPIMVVSQDPSTYHIPDSSNMPSTLLSSLVKDHISHSWTTLLDYPAAPRRLSITLAETSYRNAFVAKDVFIAPLTPVPLNMKILCPLIL
ncbi:hypothetical protein M5K25_015799 [Dendrobium thyrsiflorum]|uniref:Uncharacterized protein n=1 Tax=Dendrobium thyrsiflorum TaxID=117978 RepID=A0ABD0UY70_DENTH